LNDAVGEVALRTTAVQCICWKTPARHEDEDYGCGADWRVSHRGTPLCGSNRGSGL
jgi:hypothetical protein